MFYHLRSAKRFNRARYSQFRRATDFRVISQFAARAIHPVTS